MTKEEAIHAMKECKRVTHRLFAPFEFIYMENDMLFDEHRNHLFQDDFWELRTGEKWNKDWSIVE